MISIATEGGRCDVLLDRPERRNALSLELVETLIATLTRIAADPDVAVVVLRGAGPGFSAGIDSDTLTGLRSDLTAIRTPFAQAADLLESMMKPTVAVVHGWAFGAGFELALACDMRVIADDAKLCLPETRMGLVPDVGGCARLAAICGVAHAKELIMTSATIDGARAGELGIANRVADTSQLDVVAGELVDALLQCSPVASGHAKRVIDLACKPAHAEAMAAELAAQVECVETEWSREAVTAYEARLSGASGRRS